MPPPLYDYKCTKCQHICEVSHRYGDTNPQLCPACKEPMKKVISPVGFKISGAGVHKPGFSGRSK